MKPRQDVPLQSTALSTLIGYITGPKAEQPVGVRVVEPPPGTRQHQRGNLYVVAEIAGDHPEIDRIADHLLNTLQRSYYSLRGSQSDVMLEAVHQAQRAFWDVQAKTEARDLSAGILCAALLGGRLVVVSVGAAFALVRTNDQVHMFPSELQQHRPGSMGQQARKPEIFRQNVSVDDALFIGGGNWLSAVPVRTMASIVAFTNAETCSDAADELYEQSGRAGYAGLLIVFAPGSSNAQGGIAVTGSPPPTRPRRPRFGGLPTALGAPPPVRAPGPPSSGVAVGGGLAQASAVAERPPAIASAPMATLSPSATSEHGEPASVIDESVEDERVSAEVQASEEAIEELDFTIASPDFAEHEHEEGKQLPDFSEWTQRISDTTAAGIRQAQALLRRMLPDPTSQPFDSDADRVRQSDSVAESDSGRGWEMAEYVDLEAEADDVEEEEDGESVDPPARSLAMDAPTADLFGDLAPSAGAYGADAGAAPVATDAGYDEMADVSSDSRLVEHEAFSPPAPARGARARMFILIALAILVIVPVAVAAITWERGASLRAEAEQLTQAAEGLLIAASAALDLGDRVTARQKLTEAQAFLADAIAIDGSNEHRSNLAGSIESELQEVLQIKPLYALTSPLITFPAEARPQDILVVDEDIFVLDGGRQLIVHYQYDSSAGRVLDEQGQIVVRQGDLVDGVLVGVLSDMAWLPLITGYEDRPSLLILDRNNRIYQYDERVEGITHLTFASESDWRTVGQIQTYLGRIYIGDEGTGDIYRYAPGQYESPPQLWFSNQTQVNLSGMISMEIDGDIWLLFSNGMMLRYTGGEQVPFSLENSIGLADEPVDLYVSTQERTTLYLVDAAEDRILVYDKDGSYLHQLRAPEENLLRGLSSLFIDEVGNTMYILTQTALFTHPIVD